MDTFPPEHTDNPAENAEPHEPRLLTRRDPEAAPKTQWKQPSTQSAARVERRRGPRLLSIAGRTAVLLLIAGCVVVLSLALWLRHSMTASLPQLDGTLHVQGLSSAVTVTRDAQGVPSLRAESIDDMLFAQGYVTAQDRLWQMDALRRHAAGELAEVMGSSMVDHDRQQRILQLRTAADRAMTTMPAAQREQMEAYARGVNAFINSHNSQSHRGELPIEFRVLHYQPALWQPRDSLLVLLAMWQDLTTSFPTKMRREALSARVAPELLADLYPVGSFRDHPPSQPAPDLTTPKSFVLQIPLDSTQSELRRERLPFATPEELQQRSHSVASGADCDACRAGSNNWAVAADRSASGAPMVSNDMHLGLTIPDIWYENALHVSGAQPLDAEGFSIPGLPFIVAGRNAHVAWSFTNMGADVQDVYVEHTRRSGAGMEFERADGSWVEAGHHQEVIRVRGGRDITLDVQTTEHALGSATLETPVISPLYPSEHRTLSLAWTIYDGAALQPNFLAVNSAASGDELVRSFATLGGPALNLVWADDAKHIGYHALGFIPVRGPAEKHQRMVTPLDIPQGGAPIDPGGNPDDPDNETGAPLAMMQDGGPRLVTVAWSRPRRAVGPRRRRAPVAPTHLVPEPAPEPVKPVAASIDYSIGNPLADVPVAANDAAHAWSGYIPYDQLPATVDPAGGVLATANARIAPDDYPYAIADDWGDAYRTERIYQMLNGRTGLAPEDMLQAQLDTHSALDRFLAERLAYAIDHASKGALEGEADRLHVAADILRKWDGNVTTNAAAPAITGAFRAAFWPAVLTPQIAMHEHLKPDDAHARKLARLYVWGESNSALELLVNHQPARWLPQGFASWNDFLVATLAGALKENNAPRDLTQWKYGAQHRIEIDHPLLSHRYLGRLLGVHLDPGPKPVPGNGLTVRASGAAFGPSERFTADLVSADATNANITTGESGNPRSGWYLDQFEPWLKGTTFSLPLMHPDATHTLTLEP